MKIYSSNKLNIAIFFVLHLAFSHSRVLTEPSFHQPSPPAQTRVEAKATTIIAEVECKSDYFVTNCSIPNTTPGMALGVNLKRDKSYFKCNQDTYGMTHDNSYMWTSRGCNGLFQIREIRRVSEKLPEGISPYMALNPVVAVARGRVIAEVECKKDVNKCFIPNTAPGMALGVNLKRKEPFSNCERGGYTMSSSDDNYMWKSLDCGGLFEIREIREVSEISGVDTSTSRPGNPDPLTCGRRGNMDDGYRIVGGAKSGDCEFPWMVSLHWNGSQWCGGTILDRSHILTAAHCVSDDDGNPFPANDVEIISGTSDYDSEHGKLRSVSEIDMHPNYTYYANETIFTIDNDIAIIKLKQPFDWDSCHSPICLPDGETAPRNGGDCIVAGWGWTSNDYYDEGSRNLLWTNVSLVNCGHYFPGERNGFCADKDNRGTCNGDSGGPLACRRSDSEGYIQYGITSAGSYKCGIEPGLYADVNKFLPWINGVLGK